MNICVYETDKNIQDDIATASGEDFPIKTTFVTEDEFLKAVVVQKIDVLFINSNLLNETVRNAIKELIPYIIVLSTDQSSQTFKASLELGAKDFISIPFNTAEITGALHKAQHALASLHMTVKPTGSKSAKLGVFLSSKGGVGKSLLATNLAILLQKSYNAKVLLVDTVARFGSVDILIDINEKKSMGLIPVNLEDYDSYWQEIEDNIVTHASGVHLLVAGEKNEEPLPAQKIRSVLSLVKDKYDFIVVDAESYFNEVNLALLELADIAFFISTFDIASIKNLNAGLETIKSLYFSTDKIKIVINRFDKSNELTITELEKYIKYKIAAIIPEDRETAIHSINTGTPFVLDNPAGELSQAVRNLAECLSGRGCVVNLPSGGGNMPSANWLNKFVHLFGEK
jgi:pilus assembly protein CpaE